MSFQPTWTGDQKKKIDTAKSNNSPDSSMWGAQLAHQDIDQSEVYQAGPKGNHNLDTKDAVGVIQSIIGVGAATANKLDTKGLRSGLMGQDNTVAHTRRMSANTATMLRRTS